MGAWLVKEFTFLGIHFQNWMLVYAVILFGAADDMVGAAQLIGVVLAGTRSVLAFQTDVDRLLRSADRRRLPYGLLVMATPITSAGRFSPLGPRGMGLSQ
jgi:hypothetical protein